MLLGVCGVVWGVFFCCCYGWLGLSFFFVGFGFWGCFCLVCLVCCSVVLGVLLCVVMWLLGV